MADFTAYSDRPSSCFTRPALYRQQGGGRGGAPFGIYRFSSMVSDADWAKRTPEQPGVTGLAQATLRSAVSREQRPVLDLEHVDRCSVLRDLKVVLLTVKQVLGKGSF